MKMQDAVIEIILFDVADVIATSSGTTATTDIIWMTIDAVNTFNNNYNPTYKLYDGYYDDGQLIESDNYLAYTKTNKIYNSKTGITKWSPIQLADSRDDIVYVYGEDDSFSEQYIEEVFKWLNGQL